jgi:EAL domain-containing protein (putative c-di-GMP-specific phosphodiesterase class I)
MYKAKAAGRGRYALFDPSMNAEALGRLQLEAELRRAVERHEFRVYYQPIVSMEDGHIAELEALVRWEHPERGLIEPDDFVPLAEETGLIVPIGEWVLRQACQQVAKWERERCTGEPLGISVNLSGNW